MTNNRCERGEILGDPRDEAVREQLQAKNQEKEKIPNLFQLREKLLFQEYPVSQVKERRDTVIGLPRVLSFWTPCPSGPPSSAPGV